MSAYRMVVQALHRVGGSAKAVELDQHVNNDALHALWHASRYGLVERPGHHGRNSAPYKLTNLGHAFAEGYASPRRLPPTQQKIRTKRVIAYNWMAPLMPAPAAQQEATQAKRAVTIIHRGIYVDARSRQNQAV